MTHAYLVETVREALANSRKNGYDPDSLTVEQLADEIWLMVDIPESVSIWAIRDAVREVRDGEKSDA